MPRVPSPFDGLGAPIDASEEADARAGFHARLRGLERTLGSTADRIAERIAPVGRAVLTGDRARVEHERTAHVITDGRIRQLEDACFVVIAREAPVGADLRRTVALLRSLVDLERASKLLVHIAGAARDHAATPFDGGVRDALRGLGDATSAIFAAGAQAWRDRDGLAVNELERLDDHVDRLQDVLLERLHTGGQPVETVVVCSLLGRHWERLADHGVALAHHVSWAVTGDRVEARRGVG